MRPRILLSIGILAVLILSGGWLMGRSATPTAETRDVQQARIQAMAPGGTNGDDLAAVAAPREETIAHQPVRPDVVSMRDIPEGVLDVANQYDRWKRGEIELDNEGIIPLAERRARQEESLKLSPSDSVQQAAIGPMAPATGTSFASLDYTECCGGGGNVPPDPELAVGPNHIIAVVNVAFEIYNKSGTTLKPPTTFASFFGSSCLAGVFDPNVLYDASADRYILAIDQRGTSANRQSNYCVAVSATGDPLGTWYKYQFDTNLANSRTWMDYPHAGVGRDAIFMGGNMFTWGGSFSQARIWAFNKADMYAGIAARAVERGLSTTYDTPQPLDFHGTTIPTGAHYFVVNTNYNGDTYSIISWNNPFGTNTSAVVGTFNLETFTGVTSGIPVASVQSGTGGTLDAGDFRPLDLEYGGVDGSGNPLGWTSMTIGCNPGGGTVNCVRWAQIRLNTATIVQAGVYASNGEYRSYPDLAVNGCGEVAVGYTKSNSSSFPSVFVAGRTLATPANQLDAEALVKAGEITYTSFETSSPRRWGDYTGMTVAPDGTFWYLGEYSKNTGTTSGRWGTWIASFTYSSACGAP